MHREQVKTSVVVTDPPFLMNSSTIRLRCSPLRAMVMTENCTSLWTCTVRACRTLIRVTFPLNRGVLFAAACIQAEQRRRPLRLPGERTRRRKARSGNRSGTRGNSSSLGRLIGLNAEVCVHFYQGYFRSMQSREYRSSILEPPIFEIRTDIDASRDSRINYRMMPRVF